MSGLPISLCVCTYRRPAALLTLLARLGDQRVRPLELVVVDNDSAGSARATVEAAGLPFPARYAVEPVQNISAARNRSVAAARGEWLAFLDDDELPEPDWLERLWEASRRHAADAVLAPVVSQLPAQAPDWIARGDFFARRRFATGTVVPRNEFRIGNALIRKALLDRLHGPFDPEFGLTGGEDSDMLCRFADLGARIVWCDEAAVVEPVEHARLTLRWLLMRAWRGGNDHARHFLAGRFGEVTPAARARFVARATLQWLAALALAVLCLPLGRARWAYWLRKAYGNAGKLAALFGRRFEEYATP